MRPHTAVLPRPNSSPQGPTVTTTTATRTNKVSKTLQGEIGHLDASFSLTKGSLRHIPVVMLSKLFFLVFATLSVASAQTPAPAETTPSIAVSAGLAMTPPMGWNTWNKFACNISEQTIRSAADAMVSSGMKDAGYQYLVIDDCWHGVRDVHGDIQPDLQRFPLASRPSPTTFTPKG